MSDSFEQIIYDAKLSSCTYAHRRGNGPVNRTTCRGCMFGDPVSCDEKMRSDLVRRCVHVAAGIGSEHGDGAGRSVNIGEVATFPGAKADKAQALKVLGGSRRGVRRMAGGRRLRLCRLFSGAGPGRVRRRHPGNVQPHRCARSI